jgi:hypothetical protein
VSEETSTEPVTAADLRVGDVIKAIDGHYYAVDSGPEPGHDGDEYAEPNVVIYVTEVNGDLTPVANSEKEKRVVHAQDAVLDVLRPAPGN